MLIQTKTEKMLPVINNSPIRKGTFKGDPNGFVALPRGTIFRRRYYEYKVMIQGQPWKKYEGVYYEPNPREYENDSNETLWFKTTDVSSRDGWIVLKSQKISNIIPEETYLLTVGDDEFLLWDDTDLLTYQ